MYRNGGDNGNTVYHCSSVWQVKVIDGSRDGSHGCLGCKESITSIVVVSDKWHVLSCPWGAICGEISLIGCCDNDGCETTCDY